MVAFNAVRQHININYDAGEQGHHSLNAERMTLGGLAGRQLKFEFIGRCPFATTAPADVLVDGQLPVMEGCTVDATGKVWDAIGQPASRGV